MQLILCPHLLESPSMDLEGADEISSLPNGPELEIHVTSEGVGLCNSALVSDANRGIRPNLFSSTSGCNSFVMSTLLLAPDGVAILTNLSEKGVENIGKRHLFFDIDPTFYKPISYTPVAASA
jgi:hypothetical protein